MEITTHHTPGQAGHAGRAEREAERKGPYHQGIPGPEVRASRTQAICPPWCETIPPKDNTGLPECSDEKDQKFIDLAFAGEADFLITRDRALLAMDPQTPFSILDAAAFRRLGT